MVSFHQKQPCSRYILAAILNIKCENKTNPNAPMAKINFFLNLSESQPMIGTKTLSTTSPKKLINIELLSDIPKCTKKVGKYPMSI